MNIKCIFGIHNWYYQFPIRYCLSCHKHQRLKEYIEYLQYENY